MRDWLLGAGFFGKNMQIEFLEENAVKSKVLSTLIDGGVVIIPTDTLYGFSSVLSSGKGYERIVKIKKCKGARSFLLVASDLEMVERYISSWGSTSKEELGGIWPAPLTAILPAGSRCPDWVEKSIAFRIPAYGPLREIVGSIGEPVISTSVNVSGQAPLHRMDEIIKKFGGKVDLIVGSKAECQDLPSTIVDFTHSEPYVIRQGSYPW